jgi:hypothetical protein
MGAEGRTRSIIVQLQQARAGVRSKNRKDRKNGDLCMFRVAAPDLTRYGFCSNQRAAVGVRLMDWARILLDQELLVRNEYLAAENRILKARLKGGLHLSDAERTMLGKIGHRLDRKVLAEVANVARPDTILGWYRKLVARKFGGSQAHRGPSRPRISREVEHLIVRMAEENSDWGYDRIVGALANLGV